MLVDRDSKICTVQIDFQESAEQHRTVVLRGVDDELDNMKRTYDGLESLLSEVAKNIAKNVPADLQMNINSIYFPQIGFLIAAPLNEETGRASYEGDDQDPWERMFSTESTVYYKNPKMSQLDDYFGDIHGLICSMFHLKTPRIFVILEANP